MKNKMRLFTILSTAIVVAATIYIVRKIYKENELRNLLNGISKLNNEDLKLVAISNKTNRYLLRNDDQALDTFHAFMESKGWKDAQGFGRSLLYSRGGEEMLVKKTDLINGYSIFEWMDESYVQNKAL